jgi:hypothetical protein
MGGRAERLKAWLSAASGDASVNREGHAGSTARSRWEARRLMTLFHGRRAIRIRTRAGPYCC